MKNILVVLAPAFLFVTAIYQGVPAETIAGGVITGDVRWSADESPYLVMRDILVEEQGSLTIGPGTRILVGKPTYYDDSITQLDGLDSHQVSIRIKGVLKCMGRSQNRITISSMSDFSKQCAWYGVVIEGTRDPLCEIAYTDLSGACHGLMIKGRDPIVRNCVFEYNNVGITCLQGGNADIYNSIIAFNHTTGILLRHSNPTITNSIVAFNRNSGVWCDRISKFTFTYNCVFGNSDGNFVDCNPKLGILSRKNKNGDSTDYQYNIFLDPVFAGSPADSLSRKRDMTQATAGEDVIDTSLARIIGGQQPETDTPEREATAAGISSRYLLSKYSPCRDAGDPSRKFNDSDGSPNDMGIHGGQEFMEIKQR